MMIKSAVDYVSGVPTLTVNGKAIPEAAYITYFLHKNCYSDFAEQGYKLFSVPMFFSTRTINEIGQLPPLQEGIYENDIPDYSIIDKNIQEILSVCPDAYIIPRVNVNLSRKWEKEHPGELCDESYQENKCFSFASDLWAEEVKRLLGDFIGYIETTDYKDSIIGYQLAAGNTEEWFPVDPNASDSKRAREKFAQYCKQNNLFGTKYEYRRFLSEVVAGRITELAAVVKECTQRRLVVGTFYGYTLTCTDWKLCHHALNKVLGCDDIDFICSPICYSEQRRPGTDAYNMLPVDSVKLHNKLYFVENDTRTHLSAPPNKLPHYNRPVWCGPEKEVSREIMKMHFSRALTHGHGFWWFDMWGGWFKDEDYLDIIKKSREILTDVQKGSLKSRAQIAVFIDEKSYALIDENSNDVVYAARRILGLIGAPYDIYLADDFENVYKNYRALVFIIPAKTKKVDMLTAKAEEKNIPSYKFTAENTDTAPEKMMKYFKDAMVSIYTDKPAVVYANESYIFIHTASDGVLDFEFDGRREFTDLFDGKKYKFPCDLPFGKSLLFKCN